MLAYAVLAAELVATIAIFALTNQFTLAFRNPHRTGWLKSSGAQLAVEMVCISAVLIVVPVLGAGIFAVIPGLLAGGVVLGLIVIGIYMGLERAMGMKARLELCDRGYSPFSGSRVSSDHNRHSKPPEQPASDAHACSSSTKVPQKSLG